jgi:hypothetical protein
MKIPAIARPVLEALGDIEPRPHPNCYWLIPGKVLAGEYPASQFEANATARIDALLDAGIRRFVDLTEEHERPGPYASILDNRARSRNLRIVHRRFAIPDCGVPSTALMRAALDAIYEGIAAEESVYVHCKGGIGRTGTVIGCLLREQGLTNVETLELIASKWQSMEKRSLHPKSPEWPEQFAFIEQWGRS